ncbi:unnamed protein product, partial [Closterium sp. NIES-53]
SSLYTLPTEPPPVAPSAQVSASGQVAASCSCRLLSHQTLLWHHRLGHPSLPRLRGMYSRLLVSGLPSERYFLMVVDDYTLYTTVFPLRSKGEVSDVMISWIHTVRLQLRERFGQDLPVLRLHSDRGSEFSSDLLQDFCRRIGLVMEVARTSMIHAAAPHFLWPFAVRYAAHQLNLRPRVSLPKTSPTLRWTGKVGDATLFRDVTFDESVPFYRLFPYRSAPPPPPPLFLAPGPPPVDPLPPQSPAPSGVSHGDPLLGTAPVQVDVGSGAAPGAATGGAAFGGAETGGSDSEGAGSWGAEPGGEEHGGAEPAGVENGGVEPGGAESEGLESGGAKPRGAASSGGPASASPRLSPQQLHEWFVRHARLRSGAIGAGGAGDAGVGGAGVTTGAGGTGGTAATGPGGARTRGTGAAGTGGVEGAGAGDPTDHQRFSTVLGLLASLFLTGLVTTLMPFWLTIAPTTFQMTMNEAFRPLLDKCVIVYLDDILVYSWDKQKHLADMEAVFKVLYEHRLLTKGSKCV